MSGNDYSNTGRRIRSALLAGTAALAIVGGAAGAGFFNPSPASAENVSGKAQAGHPFDFADLVEAVSPAVVSVEVERDGPEMVAGGRMPQGTPQMPGLEDLPEDHPFREFFKEFEQRFGQNEGQRGEEGQRQRRAPRAMGQGSGFVVSDDGYVVTNNHVAGKAKKITVKMKDGSEYDAKLVGADSKTDLALLKIEADEPLPFVSFADDRARVGQWVVAVGNPFGLGGTVTAGIVSADGRDIGSGPYDDYIQIDAPVNRGNSGGPTFNIDGKVIGVNTAIFSPSGGNVGIAFAIPASVAVPVIEELKQTGMVSRGWLGVQIQPVTDDIAESLGLDAPEGAIVASILDSGPAGGSGIVSGDVILSVNGATVEDARDLARKIGDLDPDQSVDLELWRDGSVETVSLKLGRQPGETEQVAMTAPEPEDSLTTKFGLAIAPGGEGAEAGVRIVEVDPDSEAARKGLQAGDVIIAAGGADVGNPQDVTQAVRSAEEKGRKAVLFRVRSGDNERFVALAMPQA